MSDRLSNILERLAELEKKLDDWELGKADTEIVYEDMAIKDNELKKEISELKQYVDEHIKEIHTRSHNHANNIKSVLVKILEALNQPTYAGIPIINNYYRNFLLSMLDGGNRSSETSERTLAMSMRDGNPADLKPSGDKKLIKGFVKYTESETLDPYEPILRKECEEQKQEIYAEFLKDINNDKMSWSQMNEKWQKRLE